MRGRHQVSLAGPARCLYGDVVHQAAPGAKVIGASAGTESSRRRPPHGRDGRILACPPAELGGSLVDQHAQSVGVTAPRSRAARSQGVEAGWYTRSTTTCPGLSRSGSSGKRAAGWPACLGQSGVSAWGMPAGVALTTRSTVDASSGRPTRPDRPGQCGCHLGPALGPVDHDHLGRTRLGQRHDDCPGCAACPDHQAAPASGLESVAMAQRGHEPLAVGVAALQLARA